MWAQDAGGLRPYLPLLAETVATEDPEERRRVVEVPTDKPQYDINS